MKWIRRYPELGLLFAYNSGMFVWLQTSGQQILDKVLQEPSWMTTLPQPIQAFVQDNTDSLAGLLTGASWSWLVVSMACLLLLRVLKGIVKWTLMALLVGGGFYLYWKYKSLLSGLL